MISSEILTWLSCVCLASLGSDAVDPAGVGVLDKASQVVEELREGHAAGLIHSVVEQSSAPQCGVFPEQDTVDAGQTLLCRVQRLQVVFLTAQTVVPWLVAVVDTSEVMCAWWTRTKIRFTV